MAHVIARKKNGPRGSEKIDPAVRNKYPNLILLCPNHHDMIDKAPSSFSVDQILQWKKDHEERIKKQNEGQKYLSQKDLFIQIKKILIENKHLHDNFGPNSFVARRNPLSEFAKVWQIRKVATMIPNNTRIINIIEANIDWLSPEEYLVFVKFKHHAIAFENNTYERMDSEGVPLFPSEFNELVEKGAK